MHKLIAKGNPVSTLSFAGPKLGTFRVERTPLEVNQIYNAVWTPAFTRQFQVPGFCGWDARDGIIDDINQGIYAYENVDAVKKGLSQTACRAPQQT